MKNLLKIREKLVFAILDILPKEDIQDYACDRLELMTWEMATDAMGDEASEWRASWD